MFVAKPAVFPENERLRTGYRTIRRRLKYGPALENLPNAAPSVPEGFDAKSAAQEEMYDAKGGGWNTLRATGHACHRKDAGAGIPALLRKETASNSKRNRFAVNGGFDRS